MNKTKQRKIKSIFIYLLAVALALLIYSFLVIRTNVTGKAVQEIKPSYNLQEIQKHNNIGDCWIINNNNIYDITGLIDNTYFKEINCGKEIGLDDYFIEILKNRKVGILS